ncbi:MAG: hypothetical protein DCC75_12525, partial [Proteobacteria bacterium]
MNPWSWLATSITTAVLAALFLLCTSFWDELSAIAAHQELEAGLQSVLEGSTSVDQEVLKRCNEYLSRGFWMDPFWEEFGMLKRAPSKLELDGVLTVFLLLRRGSYDAATNKAKQSFNSLAARLVEDTFHGTRAERERSIDQILSSLEKTRGLQIVLANMNIELAKNRALIRSAIDRHVLVARDLADLLSLAPAYDIEGTGELLTYSSGVLEGLPVMRRLPDGIADLKQLQAELEKLGAKVKVSATDQYAVFKTRFSRVSALSLEIVADYKSLNAAKEDLRKRQGSARSALRAHTASIESQLRVFLLDISDPRNYS